MMRAAHEKWMAINLFIITALLPVLSATHYLLDVKAIDSLFRRLIGRSGWLVSTNVYTFIWLIFAKKVNLLCSSLAVTYMEFYYSPLVSFWWWNANWLARYWIDCDLMSCEEFLSIIFFYCKYFYGFDLNYDKGACNWKIS